MSLLQERLATYAPTSDELIAAAVALRPRLRELQEEHAQLGTYGPEIHEYFVEHRFYDMLRPKRYGGLEVDLDTFFRVAIEVSRGDPGVGWSFELGASHAYQFASHFPEAAQDEAFGSAYPFIAPSRAFPLKSTVTKVDGGYRLSGLWDYNSGCTYATHMMPVAPVTLEDGSTQLWMFILPRKDFEILPDWGFGKTIGLHASSSNSIEIEDAFVADHNAVPFNFKDIVWGDEGTPGWQIHQNPLYLGRTAAVFIAGLTQTQVGNALACMDEWLELMERGTSFAPRGARKDSQFYQHWTGEIVSAAEASKTLLLGALREYMELNAAWTQGGAEFTIVDDVRIRGQIIRAAQLAQQAIETAYMYGGTSSVALAGRRMGKYYQDAAMYRTHIGYMPEVMLTNLGRVLSGQPLQM